MDRPVIQDARQLLAALHKRRGLLASCVAVSLLAATVYNFTTRPLYQATVQILLQDTTPDVLPTRRELFDRDQHSANALNTQLQLLRGRALTERVIEKLGLDRSPELRAGPILGPLERLQRLLGRSPGQGGEAMGLAPAVEAFRSRISVDLLAQSTLVNLQFVAYDAELAALAANSLAETYIEQSLEFRYSTSTEATGWLSARLREQEQRVQDAKRGLQQWEEREGIINLEERQGLVEQKLQALNAAVMDARTERITKETLYAQIRELPPEELDVVPLVMGNAVVQSLRASLTELERQRTRLSETLGERHPDMLRNDVELDETRAKLAAEKARIVRSVESAYLGALQREENLQAGMEPVQREAMELKRKAIEHGVLKREVEANEQLFQGLMSRTKESGLESELEASDVRIVERARVPPRPVAPRVWQNYQIALLLGLAVGFGLVLLLEQLDNTLKTPEDVRELLQLPFLGMIPDAAAGAQREASPLILGNPRCSLTEAYRVVRTNLIFAIVPGAGRALLVTSVNAGEGKSTTVLNLAASLVQNGSRVLVVDGDLRRPTLHKHLDVPSLPGLSDLIVGNCRRSEAIRATSHEGLEVLPCGYIPPNPAELLGSSPMAELLRELRGDYDWVLIDAPPGLAMADVPVLAPLSDGVLLVVAAEKTPREAVERAREQLASVGAKIVGVVLNRVDLDRNSYYFRQYYGEYYRSYYGRSPAEAGPPEAAGREPIRRA